ncbi:hypothetical protein PUND_a0584 [Pseudoalteromonas undina]|nr:hypothetical protein PUND_a0584 [Pseudoalteromonas undina]
MAIAVALKDSATAAVNEETKNLCDIDYPKNSSTTKIGVI